MQLIIHLLCIGVGIGILIDASTNNIRYAWIWASFGVGATIIALPIYLFKRKALIETASISPFTTTNRHRWYFGAVVLVLMLFSILEAQHGGTVKIVCSSDLSSGLTPIGVSDTFPVNQKFYVSVQYPNKDVFPGHTIKVVLRQLGQEIQDAEVVGERTPEEGENMMYVSIVIHEPGGYKISAQSGGEILAIKQVEIR